MEEYRYYVGGEFRRGGEKIEVVNPATEEAFAYLYEADEEEVKRAVKVAKQSQTKWRKSSFKERAALLREIAKVMLDNLPILAGLETKEIGKPHKESLFVDVPLGAQCFNYYASLLEAFEEKRLKTDTGIDFVRYEPYGVCGVFLPFNVPLMIFGFSCAAALAAGNAVIIKPSEWASLSLLELARYLDKLDFPSGLINVVTGKGEKTGKFLASSSIDLISFTGSRESLKRIVSYSASFPKKIICELGGANLTLIFSDVDKRSAIDNLLASSFMKQGQMCIGTSVALIEEDIYDEVIEELVAKVKKIKIGDPFDPTVGMGAIVSKEHLKAVDRHIKEVLTKGAKLLCGGTFLNQKGYFYQPTVIELKDVIYDEFFAPVLLVKKFKATDAEKIIEKNPTGLVLQIWTQDTKRAYHLAEEACCGTVWINTFAQLSPQTPFGGMRLSGWGRNLGVEGFMEYSQPKHIGIGLFNSPVEGWFGI